jgi:aminotransferase
VSAHTPSGGERATEMRYSLIELAERLPDVVSLGRGDPDLHTPHPIVEAAVRELCGNIQPSPVRGLARLRSALAERYRREKGLDFDPETEILVTTGAQEGLFLAMLALIDPGDRILVPDPRYSSYDQAIETAGGSIVEIPTRLERDFRLDPRDFAERADLGKVLILVNPSNPTSAVVPPDDVRAIAAAARAAGVTVISDEIYESLVFDGLSILSVAACDGMRERTVTLSGFSKTYAMAGFRVGYLLAPAPFIDAAVRLKAAATGPCPLLSQFAALAALEGPQDSVNEFHRIFDRRRRLMMAGFDRLGIPYSHPSGGFYLWADVSRFGMPAEAFCRRLLEDVRVLMFPGSSFGKKWGGYVRISLLQPEERLMEGMGRIEQFVASLAGVAGS